MMMKLMIVSGLGVLTAAALTPVPAEAQRHGWNRGHGGGWHGGRGWRGPRHFNRGPRWRGGGRWNNGWRGPGWRGPGWNRGWNGGWAGGFYRPRRICEILPGPWGPVRRCW
jgi:hypothetical protein